MERQDINTSFDLPYSNQPSSTAHATRAYAKIKIFRAELHQVDFELALLLAKRARLVHHIVRCKTVVAPHKNLPTELIREIISVCAPVSQAKALPLDGGEHDPRLVVTQICSSWRHIAFDIPILWKVTFSCNDPPQGSVHLADAWFRECTGSTLALKTGKMSISLSSVWLSRSNSVLTELVLPHSKRFRTLDLDLDPSQWDMIRSQPFDNLSTLYLPPRVTSRTIYIGELVCAPSLRSVHVKGTGHNDDVNLLPILPWTQLTNLSLSGHFTAHTLPRFLAQCTSLESCDINNIALSSTTPIPDVPIHLPHLATLSIAFASPRLFDLLSSLRSPCISSLKLDTLPKNEEAIAKFAEFIYSISGTLRHFEIARAGWHGFVRQEYLSPMTSLTRFIIPYGHFFTSPTLALIGTGELLPNIERLGFSVSDKEEDIVDMLVTRNGHDARTTKTSKLSKVDILSQGIRWGDLERSKLQTLRSHGMDISVLNARF